MKTKLTLLLLCICSSVFSHPLDECNLKTLKGDMVILSDNHKIESIIDLKLEEISTNKNKLSLILKLPIFGDGESVDISKLEDLFYLDRTCILLQLYDPLGFEILGANIKYSPLTVRIKENKLFIYHSTSLTKKEFQNITSFELYYHEDNRVKF